MIVLKIIFIITSLIIISSLLTNLVKRNDLKEIDKIAFLIALTQSIIGVYLVIGV